MKKICTITALYEFGANGRPHGSAYIRTILPLSQEPVHAAYRVKFDTAFSPADIVVVERTWHPWITVDGAESLLRQVRAANARLIYTVDDNLFDADDFYPAQRIFNEEQLFAVRRLIRQADRVVVSTEPLADRIHPMNPEISIIPNHLDARLFPDQVPARNRQKLTLGYMGTPSHKEDLMLILEPLRKFLHHHRETARLEICGIHDDLELKQLFGDLPVKAIEPEPGQAEYPNFARWMSEHLHWDIGLAPLQDNVFTRCKSDIKWLDYALLGIPGIYSRVPAYASSIRDRQTGLLTDNTPAEWFRSLCELAENPDLRDTVRNEAFTTVRENRTLQANTDRWLELLQKVSHE